MKWTEYLLAGGRRVGMRVSVAGGATSLRYFIADHLGSISVVTGETGLVLERLSYDAWGKRRLAGWQDGTPAAAQTTRGYTGHEMIDAVGLVNMNGRIQDPTSGKFLSSDPTIPDPLNGQAFNRYAYVVNNPLTLFDPTGFSELPIPQETIEVICCGGGDDGTSTVLSFIGDLTGGLNGYASAIYDLYSQSGLYLGSVTEGALRAAGHDPKGRQEFKFSTSSTSELGKKAAALQKTYGGAQYGEAKNSGAAGYTEGVGGTFGSTYSYSTARLDRDGRGSLGFAQMKMRDLQTNIVETTNFRQDYPHIGLVASKTVKLDDTQTLSALTNSYATPTNLGDTRRFPHLAQSVETRTDLDGTPLPTVTTAYQYDCDTASPCYGNVTQIAVSTPDGSTKTTSNSYDNDPANWLLGRLSGTSVTSTVPDPGGGGGGSNQAPAASNDTLGVAPGGSATFDPRTNDTDPDGDSLTITAKTDGAGGTVQILSSGNLLKYTPNSGFSGSDSFTYTVSDGHGHTATASVAVTVSGGSLWGSFNWGGANWGP